MSEDLQARMQGILDAFVAQGIVGASAAVVAGGGAPVTAVAGLADRERGTPVNPSHLFKNGSCTKTFVAATLMRLARAGTVRLDDPAARWFPDLPKGDRIRVRDLVNHRSGLPEFEFDMPMTPGLQWTPQAIVDLAFRARPQDEPHRVASYSNTGYVLAGMVIEAATGDSLAGQVRREVLQPLGLSGSFCAAGEPFPEDRLARGHYHRPPPPAGGALSLEQGGEMWAMDGILPYSDELQDSTGLFPFSGAYAAGDMVSTPRDMALFLDGLFGGRLFEAEWLAQMADDRWPAGFPGTRMRESGAGLFLSAYAGRQTLGHQGSIPGYVSLMQHHRDSGVSAALLTNTGSGNRLSVQASGLHDAFDRILEAALA
ncbi:serine hydrolase domain-containing protein [Inquilinus sp.]|jgi:D-alanyl-D-alanine carboxypeptidase|uniref:serine hydrolase domain-containing protein n=1 Tax=Inquilinus sp. TaxID=1932117 RepID=UPI0037834FF7